MASTIFSAIGFRVPEEVNALMLMSDVRHTSR
jgi:hypothetical protein